MDGTNNLKLINECALPFLLSLPEPSPDAAAAGKRPVLCFLHGYMEGPPTEIVAGLTAHGPLSRLASPLAAQEFIVAAPQLPARGDFWRLHPDAVRDILLYVHNNFGGDPARSYLTGFSYGGNGVLDVALVYPELWAALWPVDPTRVPVSDPGLPLWLSSGEASRPGRHGFVERLQLKEGGTGGGERVYVDDGLDHVGTATNAYRSDSVYRWLLSKSRG
jgi:predicted peptidase